MTDNAGIGSIWECHVCRTRYLYRGITMGKVDWEKGYPK